MASVVDCRSTLGPDCQSVGIERVDIGDGAGRCLVRSRNTHDLDDTLVKHLRDECVKSHPMAGHASNFVSDSYFVSRSVGRQS